MEKKEKKESKKVVEREVETRGFSREEILRERYPLAWQKVLCYECGGIGHRRSNYREEKKIETDKKEDRKEKKEKTKKNKKKKIEKIDIAIETEREEIVEKKEKRDVEIVIEREIVIEKRDEEIVTEIEKIDEKRETELRE